MKQMTRVAIRISSDRCLCALQQKEARVLVNPEMLHCPSIRRRGTLRLQVPS